MSKFSKMYKTLRITDYGLRKTFLFAMSSLSNIFSTLGTTIFVTIQCLRFDCAQHKKFEMAGINNLIILHFLKSKLIIQYSKK